MRQKQILYVGTYERDYPRNALTIAALTRAGYRVRELHVPVWERHPDKAGRILRPGALLRLTARLSLAYSTLLLHLPGSLRGVDLVVIGYIGQGDMLALGPPLRLTRRPLLFNPLITLTDTLVEDRGLVRAGSGAARLIALLDRLTLRLADAVLVDTPENGRFLVERFGTAPERVHCLPVGADEDVFRPSGALPAGAQAGPLRVLFFGKMIPLHGVETIVRAAALLREEAVFEIVGRGQLGDSARALARELGTENVRFTDWLPYERLPERIARADVVLGIFGESGKAARVVPNKVYQAMAMGAAIVTRDSPAIRRVLEDGRSTLLVPPGDPEALARAIGTLRDRALRVSLGEGARAAYVAHASLDAQAARLSRLVESLAGTTAQLAVAESGE